jgi:coenzyme F420-reducing hydrogenase alpha subunit
MVIVMAMCDVNHEIAVYQAAEKFWNSHAAKTFL